MTFARNVFYAAGTWGMLLLTVIYLRGDTTGVTATPPGAQFYYGFLGVTTAWQAAFFVIASDPLRYRPLMVPAIVEKFGYILSMAVLYALGQVGWTEAQTAIPDVVLGVLFIAAYARTPRS